MQLYDEAGDQVWANYTGHHFHSFYLDRLFYFGGLGVLLVVLVPLLRLLRTLWRAGPLSAELVAVLSFVATFFVFGISYDWPGYLYGVLGLLLATVSFQAVPVPPRVRPAPRNPVAVPALTAPRIA